MRKPIRCARDASIYCVAQGGGDDGDDGQRSVLLIISFFYTSIDFPMLYLQAF